MPSSSDFFAHGPRFNEGFAMTPKSPEELALCLREATANLVPDAALTSRVLARARAAREVEGPAFFVLVLAASIVFWFSVHAESGRGTEADGDVEPALSLDVAEASL